MPLIMGKLIFPLWGKIVRLYLLRVNLARFFALGSIPLRREATDSDHVQAYGRK
jgi:hypothetical protein